MPIHGYIGNVITANPTAPTSTVATGVWTTEQQLQATAAGNWPGYEYPISRSLRFNSADSAYLNRTPASASNRRTWTYSFWVKRAKLSRQMFFGVYTSSSDVAVIEIEADQIYWYDYLTSSYRYELRTTQVLRDPSAWYHIMCVLDTTQATSSNRNKIYINGYLVTALTTATYPTQNLDGKFNTAVQHSIGTEGSNLRLFLDAYQTETYFIDGQALEPSSFGLNDPETGVWSPKRYTGTYGTNGFYLNFSDNSGTTSTTLGKDSSGNGNNWTPNNFSVTAGAGNDSMVDSPTAYGTDTGVGGEVRGNYSTLNPLFVNNTYPITYSNGNLNATRAGGGQGGVTNTFGMSSGKWYWEIVFTTSAYNFGITTNPAGSTLGSEGIAGYNGGGGTSIGLQPNGVLRTNGTAGSTYTSWTTNDVMGIALDMDGGNLYIYKNGTAMNSGNAVATSLTSSTWFFITSLESGAAFVANFGQRAFAYTAPSGFKALVTTNLPTPTIGATSTTQADNYFGVALYSGTGSGNSNVVSGLEFTTDLWWQKARNAANNNYLQDAVRGFGASKSLTSNSTGAEGFNGTPLTQSLSVSSTGFTVSGSDFNGNTASETYLAWCWNAGGSNATNTSGTITSTVRANTTSGFSIVTYTGTGANATVGHGLGVALQMVIVKRRSTGGTNWAVWHTGIAATERLELNATDAKSTDATAWNSTSPSSTVFSVGTAIATNLSSGTYVAYCFAPVAGYSAFGSYTGNAAADGPFIYTGFRPEFVMIKASSSTGDWVMEDVARSPYNVSTNYLVANASTAEQTGQLLDFVSNGFKIRVAVSGAMNGSGTTYIYMAFAESPFKYALAR